MSDKWKAYGVYLLVTLVVMLPLLGPGFILTLDMVFTPELPMPTELRSSYLFRAALHYLSLVIPSDVLQKILLMSILLLSGIGMHRLIRFLGATAKGGDLGAYAASIFFMINPFTYSRFMAGQYSVLLGYALLPWFVRLLIDFGRTPNMKTALKLGCLTAVIGVVSIHTVGEAVLLAAAAVGIALWHYRQQLRAYIRFGLIAVAVFVVASCYWLVPLALGRGTTAQIVDQFTAADTTVFATAGQNPVTRAGNVARLQGFWAEERGLYLLPQDRVVLWGLMALIIIGLVVWGGVVLWYKQRVILVLLVASGLTAAMLAVGLMELLAKFVPLLAGYREPHKFVGLVALVYSILLAFGIKAMLDGARRRSEGLHATATVLLLLLPFLFTRIMLWGFDGQLTPRQYPADWFSVDQRLQQDNDDFEVLFLPWHQYMSFQFSGRIIASPAPAFFSKPTIVSADPELDGAVSGRMTDRQKAIDQILGAQGTDFAGQLGAQNIKYIILAKDLDYRDYDYLNNSANLGLIKDYPTAALYENQAWRRP